MSQQKAKHCFTHHGGSASGSSVLLTLPIACQICLGKVKEPTICPNQHVFCYSCLNEWLKSCKMCPACRVPITETQPCKRIIGSIDVEPCVDESSSFRAQLRRTRMEVLLHEYEDDFSKMEIEMDKIVSENMALKKQVHSLQRSLEAGEEKLIQMIGDNGNNTVSSSSRIVPNDLNTVLLLSSKLQDMVHKKEQIEEELQHARQELKSGQIERARLTQEVSFLRDENMNSPKKISSTTPRHNRYTVLALQTKLDNYEREIHQLKRALERSDEYTEYLQTQMTTLRRHSRTDNSHDDVLFIDSDNETSTQEDRQSLKPTTSQRNEDNRQYLKPTTSNEDNRHYLKPTTSNEDNREYLKPTTSQQNEENDNSYQATSSSTITKSLPAFSVTQNGNFTIMNNNNESDINHRLEHCGTLNSPLAAVSQPIDLQSPISGTTLSSSHSNTSTPDHNVPNDKTSNDRYNNPTLYPACAKLIQLTRAHQSTNLISPQHQNKDDTIPISPNETTTTTTRGLKPYSLGLSPTKIVSSTTENMLPRLSPSENNMSIPTNNGASPSIPTSYGVSPSITTIYGASPSSAIKSSPMSSPLKETRRSIQRVELCTPPSLKRIKSEPDI